MVIREVTERSLEQYAIEQIKTGYTALSNTVAQGIDTFRGRLFLIMPAGLETNRVQYWDSDPGKVKQREADGILAQVLGNYLNRGGNRVLIQDFEARRTDPSFTDDPLRISCLEELYWELQGTEIPLAKIEECVRDASCWPWICYFRKERRGKTRYIAHADLETAAAHLVGVGIQALHDSYMFWWRTDLEPFPFNFAELPD